MLMMLMSVSVPDSREDQPSVYGRSTLRVPHDTTRSVARRTYTYRSLYSITSPLVMSFNYVDIQRDVRQSWLRVYRCVLYVCATSLP